jgi:hypothetical protein
MCLCQERLDLLLSPCASDNWQPICAANLQRQVFPLQPERMRFHLLMASLMPCSGKARQI